MKVHVTIEREEGEPTTSMGISASGVEPYDVCRLLLEGAEMVVYDMVRDQLRGNGGGQAEVDYAAPLRTRLLTLELLMNQDHTPYSWVQLDITPPVDE